MSSSTCTSGKTTHSRIAAAILVRNLRPSLLCWHLSSEVVLRILYTSVWSPRYRSPRSRTRSTALRVVERTRVAFDWPSCMHFQHTAWHILGSLRTGWTGGWRSQAIHLFTVTVSRKNSDFTRHSLFVPFVLFKNECTPCLCVMYFRVCVYAGIYFTDAHLAQTRRNASLSVHTAISSAEHGELRASAMRRKRRRRTSDAPLLRITTKLYIHYRAPWAHSNNNETAVYIYISICVCI